MVPKFVSLSREDILELVKSLETLLPRSAVIFNVTKLYLQDCFNTENVCLKFYAFEKILDADIFIVSINEKKYDPVREVVVFCPKIPSEEMLHAFESLIDWKEYYLFSSFHKSFSPFITEMCNRKGSISLSTPCQQNLLLKNQAPPSFDVIKLKAESKFSKDIRLTSLSIHDVKTVVNKWKFTSAGTETEMKDLITKIGSAAIYTNENELVSWVVLSTVGSLSALHTVENHRKKGYAEIVATAIVKVAADKGLIPLAEYEVGNQGSKNLMEKIGLSFAFETEWINYNPSKNISTQQ